MKLVYVIVPDAAARPLLAIVIGAGLRCTRFDSQGGFWRARNSTLLIGVEDVRLPKLLDLIRIHLRQRLEPRQLPFARQEPRDGGGAGAEDRAVGHATVFVQVVERYERCEGKPRGGPPIAGDASRRVRPEARGGWRSAPKRSPHAISE